MRIALDFDGTITADRGLWAVFAKVAVDRGHYVAIVTMRPGPLEHGENRDITEFMEMTGLKTCIFTSGGQKADHFKADIWIDDMPDMIPSKDSFMATLALQRIAEMRSELQA